MSGAPTRQITIDPTPAGTLVTDTYGPVRTATLADGTDLPVRPHTHTDYDQGAPSATNPANGEPWRLPTTVTAFASDGSAAPGGAGDLETLSTTVNGYTAVVAGDGNGWVLGTPTRVTTGGITAVSRFDAAGRTIETRQPLSAGTGAGTTKTVYYTAGPNTADTGCGTGRSGPARSVGPTRPARPAAVRPCPISGPLGTRCGLHATVPWAQCGRMWAHRR